MFCILLVSKIESQTNQQEVESFNLGLQTTAVVGVQSPGSAIKDYVYGMWGQSKNVNNEVKGSIYFIENWKAKGNIYSVDKKKYKISNLNINLKDNRIEAKFDDHSKDSIFVFKNSTIEKVTINNKVFTKKRLTLKNKTDDFFVEKLKSTKKTGIYKLHYVFFKEGEFDRLSQKKTGKDRYIKAERYFIKKENEKLKPIKLKKSDILKVFAEKKKEIKDYIKKNKLKVKEEQDFIKLLHYYDTL